MTDADPGDEATLFPKTAGERLREARESQGMSLTEVAARTRVPLRHLEAIEKSDYSGLPSPTYSVGFAKAYARAIGMDEVIVGRDVRGQTDMAQRPPEYQPYEMQDLKRLPPPGLAMAGVVAAVIVLIAAALWFGTNLFRGDGEPAAIAPPVAAPAPPAAAPILAPASAPAAAGQVTLVATDIVWLRVYDSGGKTLYEAEMKPGDRYDVPGDASTPMINIGRPDKLQVLVNGSVVPRLGDGSRAIKDIGISATALLARGSADAAVSPVPRDAAAASASDAATRPAAPKGARRRAASGGEPPLISTVPPPVPATTASPATQPPGGEAR